jgi:hypothetical protein
MSSLTIAWITFACVFGGALLGMFLRNVVPEDHLNQDSRDALKLGAGLIATMAALVISLLISSAKGSFDKQNDELKQVAANLILTDRILAQYGRETKDIRDLMQRSIISIVDLIWPEDHPRDAPSTKLATVPERVETVENEIRALTPRDDVQRSLQARALQISADEAKIRWLLFGQLGQGSIPTPFLILLVAWLVVIFMTFGLLAPRNTTVILVMLLCALSVSGALFLILEMDQPFQGWLKISSAPLRYTIAHLGQ